MITFDSDRNFAATVRQAKSDLAVWRACNERTTGHGNQWVDNGTETISCDREMAIQLLQSPEPRMRLTALSLLVEQWPPNEQFAREVVRLAFGDPHANVRGAALVTLMFVRPYIFDSTGFLNGLLSELFARPTDSVVADILEKTRHDELRVEEAMTSMWNETAGMHAATMLESRRAAELCLASEDPDVRCAAILALDKHWMSKEELALVCETLIRIDVDTKVRSLAVALLAGCYMHTDDKRVGRLLAELVRNPSNARELRINAYISLFTVRQMPLEKFMRVTSPAFCFPEDIDWPFVQSFVVDA